MGNKLQFNRVGYFSNVDECGYTLIPLLYAQV